MNGSNIPIAHGTPVGSSMNNVAAAIPVVVPMAAPKTSDTGGRPNLESATRLNGGRSSRFSLPIDGQEHTEITNRTIELLMEQGYTRGLAESLRRNKMAFPLSIWIVDNSGSMQHQDGHRILQQGNNKKKKKNQIKFVPCTRWSEMQQTVEYHALMAGQLQSPTIFRYERKKKNDDDSPQTRFCNIYAFVHFCSCSLFLFCFVLFCLYYFF